MSEKVSSAAVVIGALMVKMPANKIIICRLLILSAVTSYRSKQCGPSSDHIIKERSFLAPHCLSKTPKQTKFVFIGDLSDKIGLTPGQDNKTLLIIFTEHPSMSIDLTHAWIRAFNMSIY